MSESWWFKFTAGFGMVTVIHLMLNVAERDDVPAFWSVLVYVLVSLGAGHAIVRKK